MRQLVIVLTTAAIVALAVASYGADMIQERPVPEEGCLTKLNLWLRAHDSQDLLDAKEATVDAKQVKEACSGKDNEPVRNVVAGQDYLFKLYQKVKQARVDRAPRYDDEKQLEIFRCEYDVWDKSPCSGGFNKQVWRDWQTICRSPVIKNEAACHLLEPDPRGHARKPILQTSTR